MILDERARAELKMDSLAGPTDRRRRVLLAPSGSRFDPDRVAEKLSGITNQR
jgi:hypothetical protein